MECLKDPRPDNNGRSTAESFQVRDQLPGKVLRDSERHFVAILGETSGGDIVFAYESVWAIGTGDMATREDAQDATDKTRPPRGVARRGLRRRGVHPLRRLGQIKERRGDYVQEDVDGGLVGNASLEAESFVALVNAAANAKSG